MRIAIWSVRIEDNHGQGIITGYVLRNVLMPLGPVARFEFPAGGSVPALLAWLGAALRLLLGVVLRRYDLVYVACSRSNLGFVRDIPALACARLGCRVVVHAHGSDIADLLAGRRISPLAAWLYRRVTLIVSNRALVEACAPHAGAVHLLENYVGQDLPLATRAGEDAGFVVYWNSNVMASKGFFVVAEAVARLVRDGADIRLTAIGRVLPDRHLTMAQAEGRLAEYRGQPWFTHLGPVPQAESWRLLGAADAVALISETEAQPFSLIEAMCAGVSLVVSDIAALRLTLGDYPAQVVPVGDIDATEAALRRLMAAKAQDPAGHATRNLAQAQAARRRFSRQQFDAGLRAILGAA